MPGEGIEVSEGRFRHAVPEIRTPSSEHRIEKYEEISKAVMTCLLRQRPPFAMMESNAFFDG